MDGEGINGDTTLDGDIKRLEIGLGESVGHDGAVQCAEDNLGANIALEAGRVGGNGVSWANVERLVREGTVGDTSTTGAAGNVKRIGNKSLLRVWAVTTKSEN